MDFDTAIKSLNQALQEKRPSNFNPSWVLQNTPKVYRYINKNIRTENNDLDWDKVTSSLDRCLCKCWVRYRQKSIKAYEKQSEVDLILSKYKDRLYTFIAYADENDRKMQSRMLISLVRLSQKGNVCAEQEVVKWITYITNDWIDKYPQMHRERICGRGRRPYKGLCAPISLYRIIYWILVQNPRIFSPWQATLGILE